LETDGKPMGYVIVGPVHAPDHDTGCFVAVVRNRPRGVLEGLILCPFRN